MSAHAASFFSTFQICFEGPDSDAFCNLIH